MPTCRLQPIARGKLKEPYLKGAKPADMPVVQADKFEKRDNAIQVLQERTARPGVFDQIDGGPMLAGDFYDALCVPKTLFALMWQNHVGNSERKCSNQWMWLAFEKIWRRIGGTDVSDQRFRASVDDVRSVLLHSCCIGLAIQVEKPV